MNIMFDESITDEVRDKYLLLELDTFHFYDIGKDRVAYCLIENAPIMEMINVNKSLELHENLMKNYRSRNWKYCEDAIEHLQGLWNKELDSFYQHLLDRVKNYKENDPGPDWSPILPRI